ncbi:hypothetical protein B0T17DRAFT_605469 [Bombardia bombarda]|uniref:SAP domain-containing protein n=1 Tax=Bombardia bombarda TaxID=252184 RepID=A0AA39XNL5_9PEZI|nr:hypothetical protein B0T17DRAFT_605469 [Bombardia bombarda]
MATDWSRLTVIDLRQELKRRGLPQAGKKADLVERLATAEESEENEENDNEEVEPEEAAEDREATEATDVTAKPPKRVESSETVDDKPEVNTTKVADDKHDTPPKEIKSEPQPTHTPAVVSQSPEPLTIEMTNISTNKTSPLPEVPLANIKNEVVDDSQRNVDQEAPKPAAESPKITKDSPQSTTVSADVEMKDAEPTTDPVAAAPEASTDIRGRKRRSRSPPPSDDESSRKRTRQSDQHDGQTSSANFNRTTSNGLGLHSNEEVMALDDGLEGGNDRSFAILTPGVPETETRPQPDTQMVPESPNNHQPGPEPRRDAEYSPAEKRREQGPYAEDTSSNRPAHYESPSYERRRDNFDDHRRDEDGDSRDVAPAEHLATSALYIKNFMRPLREPVLLDYLVELAAPPGSAPDADAVVNFYLDQIRTHAFVKFTSVTAASRVRIALHGKVWPNERNRKELWVDFIPPEMVTEWAAQEKAESSGRGGRLSRWEVRYGPDDRGDIVARLVNAETEPPQKQQPSGRSSQLPAAAGTISASAAVATIPSGPAQHHYPGIEAAPLGPRGRGAMRANASGGSWTRTNPPLPYKPVSDELAQRRIDNMRSYYTKDRYRDLGREDEINRYTFEHEESFVDRGKEVFIGIRPPHRQRERRGGGGGRRAGGGGGYGGGGPPPRGPPPPSFRPPGAAIDRRGGGGGGGFGGGGGGRRGGDSFHGSSRY